jgi:predicted dehydrogenase
MELSGDSQKTHILVIGAGSIGKRHAANLISLGASVDISDVDANLLHRVCNEIGCNQVSNLDYALNHGEYDGAIVCTPNHLHIPVALKVAEAGINLFIEKPLSHNLDGVDILLADIKKHNLIAMAGFNLRYEPGLKFIKEKICSDNIAFAHIEFGSFLPLWRPQGDYRTFYSANRAMGGGIILDDVHEIDYACWLFGYPEDIRCFSGKFSELEIDVEDTAEFVFLYKDKIVTIHCDYLQKKYSRSCKICCKNGDLVEWIFGKSVTTHTSNHESIFTYQNQFENNTMYLSEMREFLDGIRTMRQPSSDIENAAKILRIALDAKGVHS